MATRIGQKLLALAEEPNRASQKVAIQRVVANLDRTIASLGLKGPAIMRTGAYRQAMDLYHRLTGSAWAAPTLPAKKEKKSRG